MPTSCLALWCATVIGSVVCSSRRDGVTCKKVQGGDAGATVLLRLQHTHTHTSACIYTHTRIVGETRSSWSSAKFSPSCTLSASAVWDTTLHTHTHAEGFYSTAPLSEARGHTVLTLYPSQTHACARTPAAHIKNERRMQKDMLIVEVKCTLSEILGIFRTSSSPAEHFRPIAVQKWNYSPPHPIITQ